MVSRIGIDSRSVRAACLALVVAVCPRVASADPTEQDKSVAQSLFDHARSLAQAGNFNDACPLFEESQRLDPGAGTQLNLALCYEGELHLAKAYELFSVALTTAIHDGRNERRAMAEEHLATLAKRLSMLTIIVPTEARVPELILWLDGEKISSASAGVPIAVDGGTHKVEATARLHHPFSVDVEVKPERDRVDVTVPPLVPYADTPTDQPVVAPPATPIAPVAHPPPPPRSPSPPSEKERRPVAWGLGAAGLGLVTLGIGTGIGALVQNGQAKDMAFSEGCNFSRSYCPKGVTPSNAIATSQEASALGWTSTISIGVGVAAFITALAIPKQIAHAKASKPDVGVVATPDGFGLGGSF